MAPGLEPALLEELTELGLEPNLEVGGATLRGDLATVARLNLRLGVASKVLVAVGGFRATALGELQRKAADLPWTAFLQPGARVTFRVTSRKSRLYHTGAVAERLFNAAAAAVPGLQLCAAADAGSSDDDASDADVSDAGAFDADASPDDRVDAPTRAAQRFVVRVMRDQVLVRADSSGEHLHRRGYRLATGRAPLRETLAAGVLRLVGWTPEGPLVDPLCGSGTFVIEAALRACGRAPGGNRTFAFQDWPSTDLDLWRRLRAEALLGSRPAPSLLSGSDRDAGVVDDARANAERAGVGDATHFACTAISAVQAPEQEGPGLLIANPPWGRRVGDARALRDLYARLGQVARTRFAGWTLALVTPDASLARQVDRRAEGIAVVGSGGVKVGVWRVEVL